MGFRTVFSFDAVGIVGIILAIVLLVLDKAGKLKGSWLVGLLCLAGVMTLCLALGNSFVLDAPLKWRIWRGLVMFCIVAFTYSGLAIWISGPKEQATIIRPAYTVQTSNAQNISGGERVTKHTESNAEARHIEKGKPEKTTPRIGPITQGAGSAVSINQQGGITAGTINFGPLPPPPLEIKWSASDITGPDAKAEYERVVAITVNTDMNPVAIGVLCDTPVRAESMRTKNGLVAFNVRLFSEGNVAFTYYQGAPLTRFDELYLTIRASKQFSVLAVKPAKIKGLND
jgi:hypothetical protein